MKSDPWNPVMASVLCASALLFEPSSRRTQITLYLVPRAWETTFQFFVKRGYLRNIKNGDVLIYSFVMAYLMYAYQCEP